MFIIYERARLTWTRASADGSKRLARLAGRAGAGAAGAATAGGPDVWALFSLSSFIWRSFASFSCSSLLFWRTALALETAATAWWGTLRALFYKYLTTQAERRQKCDKIYYT